ncbi:MAG: hypothetical protein ACRDLB_16775 [Actinomycetota bacterium]
MMGKRRWAATVPGVAGICFVTAALGLFMGTSTKAAYSAVTGNPANRFVAGTVAVGDNDSGDLMFSLADAKPGASASACIKVTYSGSLPSTMRLYGTTSGTGLAPYLTLTVTRGSYGSPEPQFASCSNFSPDGTNYISQGSGVVYSGTLDGNRTTTPPGSSIRSRPDPRCGPQVDPTSTGSP